MARRRLSGLTLWDYSDRELLYIVHEEQSDDGWTEAEHIAVRLGLGSEHPTQNVGTRMGWMRRYGAVERHSDGGGRWRVSAIGRSLMNGELDGDSRKMLAGLDSAQLLMLTRYLTGRQSRTGATARHLIRREWKRGTGTPPPPRTKG